MSKKTSVVLSVIFAIVCLLMAAPNLESAQHDSRNMLHNGSFEKGTRKWIVFGDAQIVRGVCGHNAASLSGVLQSEIVRVRVGRAYRVSFMYRGDTLRATVLMDLPAASKWSPAEYVFVPQYESAVIAFEGIGQVDCVEMLKWQSRKREEQEE